MDFADTSRRMVVDVCSAVSGGRTARWVLATLVIALATGGPSEAADRPTSNAEVTSPKVERLRQVPATAPGHAAQSIKLQDGFRAELIASEPLVTDPVAIQYDENGLAYVVEMNDYPYSDKSHDRAWQEQTSAPIGRMRVLEDTDGDGIFDVSTVFAENLSWPAGLALWQGGVYVAATPDVLYLKDTDGDRVADIRRRVFGGFRKFNVQAVMNNLHWGLDHRIYAAGSSNGGNVQSLSGDQSQPVRLGRSDFRFDPRSETFEVISGGARFGNSFDDWGNRFLCNIRNPVQHVVLPSRYLRRNKYLPVATAVNDAARSGDTIAVYPLSPPEPWRVINAERQSTATGTKPPYDSTVPSGFVTSSSGVTIYRGAAYPREYQGNAFIGEVANNLVMRYRLAPSGVSFLATRAHDKTEFLASTDNWFRPVNFANAPDGTLHVLDMYRETIEHPWSMPDDLKARVDLTSGRDRGRIYRIVPARYATGFIPPPRPRLGKATTAELVAHLENANAWWRETAHRLIFERQDSEAVVPLRDLLHHSPSPLARLHALWSLDGLGALTVGDLDTAFVDAHASIREHAIRLAEPLLATHPALLDRVFRAAEDDAARVRFQTALTLGEAGDPRATIALAAIARRDAADPWTRVAVLSSLSEAGVPFLLRMLGDKDFASSANGRAILGQLAFIAGAQNQRGDLRKIVARLVETHESSAAAVDTEFTIAKNLGGGLRRAGQDLGQLADTDSPGGRWIASLLADARDTAADQTVELPTRQRAIELLAFEPYASVRERLAGLLVSREPQAIQVAAVQALTGFPRAEVAPLLLEKYEALTPAVRSEIVDRLFTRQDWIVALLSAIDANIVPTSRVSETRRTLFVKSTNSKIRELADRLFAADRPGPRKDVIAAYQPALSLPSDAGRGELVFKRVCLNCHRLGERGFEVGPNLATIKNRTAGELLVHILDPNREVSPNYLEYVISTRDGRTSTGVIAAETATSITLRQAEDKQQTVLRDDIEEIRSLGKSLMPEGIERDVSPQQLADLLAFLLQ